MRHDILAKSRHLFNKAQGEASVRVIMSNMYSLQEFVISIGLFINNVLLPFLFGLALLFFIWNAFRLLILKGQESDAREHAKSLMIYSIGAFVFLVSIWGLVNMLVFGLGLGFSDHVVPDYMMVY